MLRSKNGYFSICYFTIHLMMVVHLSVNLGNECSEVVDHITCCVGQNFCSDFRWQNIVLTTILHQTGNETHSWKENSLQIQMT